MLILIINYLLTHGFNFLCSVFWGMVAGHTFWFLKAPIIETYFIIARLLL
jgi:hypothetical protein